jgi:hypothetical protein
VGKRAAAYVPGATDRTPAQKRKKPEYTQPEAPARRREGIIVIPGSKPPAPKRNRTAPPAAKSSLVAQRIRNLEDRIQTVAVGRRNRV